MLTRLRVNPVLIRYAKVHTGRVILIGQNSTLDLLINGSGLNKVLSILIINTKPLPLINILLLLPQDAPPVYQAPTQ